MTGALGLIAEFSGSKRFAAIKGFDDFFAGLIFVAFFAILYSISNVLILNIVGFLCLLIGTYGTFKGLFEIVYSFRLSIKNGGKMGAVFSDILIFLTKLGSLVLVVLQVIKALQ